MISISTTTANINGNVVLSKIAGSKLMAKTARISRVKTLDGGCYIGHSGYSDGDRTLSITGEITEAQAAILKNLIEVYTGVLISMEDGLFFGAIPSMTAEDGALKMTIYIEQKEN